MGVSLYKLDITGEIISILHIKLKNKDYEQKVVERMRAHTHTVQMK